MDRATAEALLGAAAAGDASELESVLSSAIREGESVDVVGESGRTPLHLACSCGSLPAIERLLARGASRSLRDAIGWTAVHHAANSGPSFSDPPSFANVRGSHRPLACAQGASRRCSCSSTTNRRGRRSSACPAHVRPPPPLPPPRQPQPG